MHLLPHLVLTVKGADAPHQDIPWHQDAGYWAENLREVEQGGTVADVLRSGYLLHGERLLRAAQVGVAKLDEQAGAQGASSDETTSDKA